MTAPIWMITTTCPSCATIRPLVPAPRVVALVRIPIDGLETTVMVWENGRCAMRKDSAWVPLPRADYDAIFMMAPTVAPPIADAPEKVGTWIGEYTWRCACVGIDELVNFAHSSTCILCDTLRPPPAPRT